MDDEQKSRTHGEIKVVDRRRFTPEGTTRSDANQWVDREKPKITDSAKQATQKSRDQQATGQAGKPATDFLSFVASLATNAMAALGAIPQAQARGMPVDHAMAREYIDIIAMLKERTRGNLSQEEETSFTRLLGDLQAAYVEISRRGAPPNSSGTGGASKSPLA